MSDPSNMPDPPLVPESPKSAAAPTPTGTVDSNGKLFAILSYALNIPGLPFCIVPLIMRDNEFALYHAKQAFGMWLCGLVLAITMMVLSIVLAMIFAPLGCLGQVAFAGIMIGMLVLNILGLMNAINEKSAPVPFIGELALGWFKGITKKA